MLAAGWLAVCVGGEGDLSLMSVSLPAHSLCLTIRFALGACDLLQQARHPAGHHIPAGCRAPGPAGECGAVRHVGALHRSAGCVCGALRTPPNPLALLSPTCPSAQERTLCATERYLPAQYLAVKAAALKLQEQRGGRLPRADFQRHLAPFQVDPQRMAR